MRQLGYKWRLLAFLFVAFFLEQASRQVYSATLPQIRMDFSSLGVSDVHLGLVGSVFAAVFGLSIVGSGLAADFFGRKKVLVLGVVLYSLGVLGSGFARGIGCLLLCYGVVNALGQCCIAPSAYSLISEHHVETRSTAMSIFQSALYLGIVLSSVFAGSMAEMGAGGWRIAFWAVGAVGLAWSIALSAGLRNDMRGKADRADGEANIRDAFGALLRKPTAILIALAFGMFMYVGTGLRVWMTEYLMRTFDGIGLSRAAFHAVVWQNLGALVGCLATARLLDRLASKRPRLRLEMSALGFVLCIAPLVMIVRTQSLLSCCAFLGLHGVMIGVYEAAHYPAMFDCIEPRYRSAVTGLTGCVAFLIGSLAPTVIGWMSDHATIQGGILSLAWFYLAGAVILVPAIFKYFKADYIPEGSR